MEFTVAAHVRVLHRWRTMPVAFPNRGWWRVDTPNRHLMAALAASLVIHAALFALWRISPAFASLTRALAQRVFDMKPQTADTARKQPEAQSRAEVPLVFVAVDPALASAEPPKETKFYSTHNTVAANPERANTDIPKIDGTQTKVFRTTDNPKPKPLQPTPPQPLQPAVPQSLPDTAEPEKKTPPVGDLAMAKPESKPNDGSTGANTQPRPKPRRIQEVIARDPSLAGQKAFQEGGVRKPGRIAMVDAKGSPFGDYDYQFIQAVEQRWYQLLDNNQFVADRQGMVVLEFRLHYDGRITKMEVADNTVGDILSLLCQKAILDPAPFPKWPTAMRQAIKDDVREVRFTFHYD